MLSVCWALRPMGYGLRPAKASGLYLRLGVLVELRLDRGELGLGGDLLLDLLGLGGVGALMAKGEETGIERGGFGFLCRRLALC